MSESVSCKDRISKNEYYLEIAAAVSKRSTCLHHAYGAIIVKDDRIISTGYNGSPRGAMNCCDAGECVRDKLEVEPKYGGCVAVHAEQNALLNAGRDAKGATLYLYCPDDLDPLPCNLCAMMIKNAGIRSVITQEDETLF